MISRSLTAALFFLAAIHARGHESAGHPHHPDAATTVLGTEIYLGKRGYLHGGIGIATPLGAAMTLELGAHIVREEHGARAVPSFEAEVIGHAAGDLKIEAFGFGYPDVEGREAWGAGARATKRFALGSKVGISPFFGPTVAYVRAEDEANGTIEPVWHTLLLGGVTVDAGAVSVSLMGSHSIYSRDPSHLRTPVDLESMTHFAAYENNDGFARNSLAVEASWDATEWLTCQVRYAAIWFDQETRHAVTVAPSVRVGARTELTVGVQFLRGGEVGNNLLFVGLSFAF